MTRLDELINEYYREYRKIGNCETWRAVMLLYCAVVVCAASNLLAKYTGAGIYKVLFIVALVAFEAYLGVSIVLIIWKGTLNRGKGDEKQTALLILLSKYKIEWRNREVVKRLAAEAEYGKKTFRVDLTLLPRFVPLLILPGLLQAIHNIRSAPAVSGSISIAMIGDVIAKIIPVLKIIGVVLIAAAIFALLEWFAGILIKQYIDNATPNGIFARESRQLLLFEQDYLDALLVASKKQKRTKITESIEE